MLYIYIRGRCRITEVDSMGEVMAKVVISIQEKNGLWSFIVDIFVFTMKII